MNIIEKLKALNVSITPEIEKELGGDYITRAEHDKKIGKVEAERDQLKADYAAAKETLEGFEGKDFDKMTAEVAEWKAKAEQAEKDFNAKLAKRDYSDAIKELAKDIKFSSNSAKKAFMEELENNPLQLREGKVLGFEDFVKAYKENDAGAFVPEQAQTRSTFTTTVTPQTGSQGGQGTDVAHLRAIMGLSNDKK